MDPQPMDTTSDQMQQQQATATLPAAAVMPPPPSSATPVATAAATDDAAQSTQSAAQAAIDAAASRAARAALRESARQSFVAQGGLEFEHLRRQAELDRQRAEEEARRLEMQAAMANRNGMAQAATQPAPAALAPGRASNTTRNHSSHSSRSSTSRASSSPTAHALSAPTSSPSPSPSPSPDRDPDFDLDPEDLKYLDSDTKNRTQHNKTMRVALKDGLVRQDAFVRRHLREFRHFLTKKARRRYGDPLLEVEQNEGEEAAAKREQDELMHALRGDEQKENALAPVPSTASATDVAPKSKQFKSQPPYIVNGTMREYQILGLNWMIERHDNCVGGILGDEMGLGKTLQVIAFLSYLKYERGWNGPHLIVVPLSVMSAWLNEFKRWSPGIRVVRYHGPLAERRRLQNEEAILGQFDVILTTYETIVGDQDFFRYRFIWQYCILDEGHRIKNEKTLQAQALADIQRYNTILLSGTPTQNNTHEIWSLLHCILPRVFTSSHPFDACFDLLHGSINQEQLMRIHTLLKPLMMRRIKSEIAQKLPPKTEVKVYVGLTPLQREWYKRLVTRDMSLLRDVNKTDGSSSSSSSGGATWRRLMSLMMSLRKVTSHPYLISADAEPNWNEQRKKEQEEDAQMKKEGKTPPKRPSVEERAGQALIRASGKMIVLEKLLARLKEDGHRVLLFSLFTRVLDLLEDFCSYKGWSYLRLDGSTNRVRRSVDIRRFNDPNSRFFIYLISTRAGGLGINLTGADTVIHFDSDFNPQVDLQAAARSHRIGQLKPVTVYRMVTEDTVEERVVSRAEKKLYLDLMVNRGTSMAALDADSLANQPSEQEEMSKLNKDEILGMLMFGASRIFKATGGDLQDEDIDAILKRSKQKEDEAKATQLKTLMEKRAARTQQEQQNATNASASHAAVEAELLADDGHEVVEKELAELKAQGVTTEVDEVAEANGTVTASPNDTLADPSTAAAAASSSSPSSTSPSPPSSKIIENAQRSVKDFLFEREADITEFEGSNHKKPRMRRKEAAKLQMATQILDEGVKRERKQRLLLVEDSRGKSFTVLASQQDDLDFEYRLASSGLSSSLKHFPSGKKRGRPTNAERAERERIRKEQEEMARLEQEERKKGRKPPKPRGEEAKEAKEEEEEAAEAAEEEEDVEPKVIGHDYSIDWSKSSVHTSTDLERAVKKLNEVESRGTDITSSLDGSSNPHKLSLVIRRKKVWNMSEEERQEYHRKLAEQAKAAWALRHAKRLRWQEGAPEEEWLNVTDPNTKHKSKGKRVDGEYVSGASWIHEDWCHLCKLGGELICCGYCPRTYHPECVGLGRLPAGNFSCPQHKCCKCERSSQEAGGMLFRCAVCPCSYCEDDVPTEYEGRTDLDRCFELEQTGYAQPSSAFFITCSHSCTKYYADYLSGKFNDPSMMDEAYEPIPVEQVDALQAKQQAEEAEKKRLADEQLAAAEAEIQAGNKKRKGKKAAAAAAAASDSVSAPPAPVPSVPSGAGASDENFVFVPPKPEDKPHICACLMPKKAKQRHYCICKTPYDKRRNYLACDNCSQWFHLTCVGFREDQDVDMLDWTCKACQLKEKQKANRSSTIFTLPSDEEEEEEESESEEESEEEDGEEAAVEEEEVEDKRGIHVPGRKRRRQRGPGRPVKRSKVRHPFEGGNPLSAAASHSSNPSAASAALAAAAANNTYVMPTLEDLFRGMASGTAAAAAVMPGAGVGVGGVGMPSMMGGMPMGLDQAAFTQMMAQLFTSGGVVAADGHVANTTQTINPFAFMGMQTQQQQQQQFQASTMSPNTAAVTTAPAPSPAIAPAGSMAQQSPAAASVPAAISQQQQSLPQQPQPQPSSSGVMPSMAEIMAAAAYATGQR